MATDGQNALTEFEIQKKKNNPIALLKRIKYETRHFIYARNKNIIIA